MIRFWKYIIRWRLHRNIIKELNQLSDRELTDIGLHRSQINSLIWRDEDIRKRGEKTRRGPEKLL
jgi:uncharacterized protein YjiS (DUF1127 family)